MLLMNWQEVCYEILVYKSKLSKLLLFFEVSILRKDYVNKGTLKVYDIFY